MKKHSIALTVVLMLLLWGLLARQIGRELILPSPARTLQRIPELLADASFRRDFSATLLRLFVTLLLNLLLAAPAAACAAVFESVEKVLSVPVSLTRSLPVLAVILIMLIWFDSEYAVILVTSLMIFPIFYTSLLEGIRSVRKKYQELTAVYRIPARRRLFRITLPGVGSSLYTSLSTAAGLGFKVMISAEIYCQPSRAVGTAFQRAWAVLDTATLLALSLIVVLFAALADLLISRVFRKLRHVV